jgi:hypothetical protein
MAIIRDTFSSSHISVASSSFHSPGTWGGSRSLPDKRPLSGHLIPYIDSLGYSRSRVQFSSFFTPIDLDSGQMYRIYFSRMFPSAATVFSDIPPLHLLSYYSIAGKGVMDVTIALHDLHHYNHSILLLHHAVLYDWKILRNFHKNGLTNKTSRNGIPIFGSAPHIRAISNILNS